MLKITKDKEPQEWVQHRLTPGAKYEAKKYLTAALLKEQGFVCAYCMRRIPQRDSITVSQKTCEAYRIEHIKSRSYYPQQQLDYNNMVVCCPGHIGKEPHCDRSKGDKEVTLSPLDENFIHSISYNTEGIIESSNSQWNKEINEVLNLNTPLLVQNRKQMISTIIEEINKKGKWKKNNLHTLLTQYATKHKQKIEDIEEEVYTPYCGIVIWYLQRKLKQLSQGS